MTRTSQREIAREKARQLRLQQKKKNRRNRWLLQGGLVIVAIAIIATVSLIIVNSARPAAPGPSNMLSDGIKIGQNFDAVSTAPLQADETPQPSDANPAGVIDIQVYVDYQCPYCQDFETKNNDQISSWLSEGAATLEIHPISILDSQTAGTEYSTRAANAAACVANYSPNSFFNVNEALFENQPKEGQPGLTDQQLINLITGAGVTNASPITKCIQDMQFESWVKDATARALNGPIPNSDIDAVQGTPTILVNGVKYAYSYPTDPQAFAQAVSQAVGTAYNQMSTETPTPAPAG